MQKISDQTLIRTLSVVILILLAVVVYSYAVKPAINAFVIEKQIEARDMTLEYLISSVETNGYVELTKGNETLILVPYQQPEQNVLSE
jgi:hypothetical protein